MKLYRMFLKPAPQAPYTIKDVVSFCLDNNVLAYGWSGLYNNNKGINIESTLDLLEASKSNKGKPNKVLKQFLNLKQNDLVWIKDLYGIFYICRVLEAPKCNCIENLDISSTVSVELHKVGTSIPGAIFHRFYRKNSPTIERINDDEMVLYSQSVFNTLSTLYRYEIKENVQLNLWKLLNGFDLEELVLDYIQLKYDYYPI